MAFYKVLGISRKGSNSDIDIPLYIEADNYSELSDIVNTRINHVKKHVLHVSIISEIEYLKGVMKTQSEYMRFKFDYTPFESMINILDQRKTHNFQTFEGKRLLAIYERYKKTHNDNVKDNLERAYVYLGKLLFEGDTTDSPSP